MPNERHKAIHKPERERVIRLLARWRFRALMPEDVAAEARLIDDLGFDSLRLIELTMTLERAFGLPHSDPRISRRSTPSTTW